MSKESTRCSFQQVVDILQNSESDEGEFSKDYLSLDSSDDYVEAAWSESENGDSENKRQCVGRRGHAYAP